MPTMSQKLREARQEIAIRKLERFLHRSHKETRLDIVSLWLTHQEDPAVRLATLRDLAIQRGYSLADLAPYDV